MIQPVSTFEAIDRHISTLKPSRTLLLFDIDNTLLRTLTDIGSTEWIRWQESLVDHDRTHKFCVRPDRETLYLTYQKWMNKARPSTTVMDPHAPALLRRYSDEGFSLLLLTARGSNIADITHEQFRNLYGDNIMSILQDSFVDHDPNSLSSAHDCLLRNGIFFASGRDKGLCVLQILDYLKSKHGLDFDSLVFADDSDRECRTVAKAMKDNSISTMVFRYDADPRIQAAFDAIDKSVLFNKWNRAQ